MCNFSNGYYNKRQQNPLERHMTNGWKGLISSLPASLRKTSNTIWWAEGWQDVNQSQVTL